MATNFSRTGQIALATWIEDNLHGYTNDQDIKILSNYVKTLVMRKASRHSMIAILKEFIDGHQIEFVDKLEQYLKNRNSESQKSVASPPISSVVPEPQAPAKPESEANDSDSSSSEYSDHHRRRHRHRHHKSRHSHDDHRKHRHRRHRRSSSSDEELCPLKEERTRYIICVPDIPNTSNSVGHLLKEFEDFAAHIVGIQVSREKRHALVEFSTLSSAYKATLSKCKLSDSKPFIAVDVSEEELEAVRQDSSEDDMKSLKDMVERQTKTKMEALTLAKSREEKEQIQSEIDFLRSLLEENNI